MDAYLIATFCAFGAGSGVGLILGIFYAVGQREAVKKEAIAHGKAQFNPESGDFEWLE